MQSASERWPFHRTDTVVGWSWRTTTSWLRHRPRQSWVDQIRSVAAVTFTSRVFGETVQRAGRRRRVVRVSAKTTGVPAYAVPFTAGLTTTSLAAHGPLGLASGVGVVGVLEALVPFFGLPLDGAAVDEGRGRGGRPGRRRGGRLRPDRPRRRARVAAAAAEQPGDAEDQADGDHDHEQPSRPVDAAGQAATRAAGDGGHRATVTSPRARSGSHTGGRVARSAAAARVSAL